MAMFQTTAVVYRLNPQSGSPVAEDIPIALSGVYQCGSYEVTPLLRPWTHVAEFPPDTDVRDSYPGQAGSWLLGNTDTVRVPDTSGTAFIVIFVEVTVNAAGNKVKRVYLDRLHPSWPQDDV